MFRFHEGTSEPVRDEAFTKLEELGDQCSTVASWVVGRNVAVTPSAYDMIEIADFLTMQDLDEYKQHPAHKEFAEAIGKIASWTLVDFELVDSEAQGI